MDTLANVKRDVAKFVGDSGMCSDDERVLEAINDVRRVLYPLGDWKNTLDSLCLIPCCNTLTLPNQYEYARKAYRCDGNIQVNNGWYEIVNGCNCRGNYVGLLQKVPGDFVTCHDWPFVHKQGDSSCPPNGFYIKLVFENSLDIGVELTFTALGTRNRQVSLTRICEKAWTPQLALPGEEKILKILTVVKPVTHGRIRLYGYDGANEFLLGLYEKGDINPTYQRYRTARGCCGITYVSAKKKFYKLTDDKQLVDIHTEALIHGLQAITARENRDIVSFNANLSLSVAFLNAELKGPQSTATSPIKWSRLGTPVALNY